MAGQWEDREGSGVLFRNKNKTKETQPDWRGTCLIHGEPAEVVLWEKSGKRGQFFSFKLGPARERNDGFAQSERIAGLGSDPEDAPF